MKDEATNCGGPAGTTTPTAASLPGAVDRATFQAELDRLRVREKAHTREGDAIAAARQETWEDSPPGWPQEWPVDNSVTRTDGRPTAQWSRFEAGRSDDLAVGP